MGTFDFISYFESTADTVNNPDVFKNGTDNALLLYIALNELLPESALQISVSLQTS